MHYALVFIVLCAVGPEEEAPPTNPQSQLDTAITHALELLQNGRHADFIKSFAHPDDLKKILKQHEMEELVQTFGQDHAKRTIAALRHIKDAQPTLSDEGTVAEYAIKLDNVPHKKIVFAQVDGLWYIRN